MTGRLSALILTALFGLVVAAGGAAARTGPGRHPAAHAAGHHPAAVRTRPRPVRAAKPGRRAAAHRTRQAARAPRPLIVIDPGHGGRDSGAVGITGLLEKDVTLATALELRRELRAQGRFRVVLTRTRDVFASLPGRIALARAEKPALFISIHADASPDRHAHGASVYIRADTAGGARITRLPASSADSGAIGHALSAPRAPGSALLQYAMVDQLGDDIGMVHEPARQAHLYVLGTTGVPSVLVEMGFLSNRHEEHLLRQARYRRVVSEAIRDAIGDYFRDLAHPGRQRT